MYDEKGLDENGQYRGYEESNAQVLARDAAGIPYWITLEVACMEGDDPIYKLPEVVEPKQETWRDRPPLL
jgi:hypothetical protein